MGTEKTRDAKRRQEASFPPCWGDFRKMAERMEADRAGDGPAFDCCAAMMKMMGGAKEDEGAGAAKEPAKPAEGGEDR